MILLYKDVHQKRSGQAEMQFLLQMCYAPTVCQGTLPATLRLSYERAIALITDLFARLKHKVIPHGSTASNELASNILVEAASAKRSEEST